MATDPTTPPVGAPVLRYSLPPVRLPPEDILFCVDVDVEARAEMKAAAAAASSGSTSSSQPAGGARVGPRPPVRRMDAVKQAMLLFVHGKLAMCPDHRFAFAALGETVSMVKKDFSSDASSAIEAIHSISASESRYATADLTQLFKIAHQEGRRAELQGTHLLSFLYQATASLAINIIYLHDKTGPDNCPQKVYDVLVDALEHVSQYEGYILESSQGLAQVLFRHTCILLSHPLQRCIQDDIDFPKQVAKKTVAAEASQKEDGTPVSSQLSVV